MAFEENESFAPFTQQKPQFCVLIDAITLVAFGRQTLDRHNRAVRSEVRTDFTPAS
jgi:hypothetical protein